MSASLDKNAPLEFLSPEQRTAVIGSKGKLRVSLYKALFYIEVAGAIRSGARQLTMIRKRPIASASPVSICRQISGHPRPGLR